MNRRIGSLIVAVALAAILLVGCGGKKGVAYTTVGDISTLPSDISSSIVLAAHARGYVSFEDADGIYVCVSLTNGSGVIPKISSVTRDGATVRIAVEEQTVPPTSSVGSYTVIKLPASPKIAIAAVDPKGEIYPQLLIGTGSYTGQIDTTSVEVVAGGSPSAYQLSAAAQSQLEPLAADYLNLKTNDQIRFCYYRNSSGQNIIVYMAKVK